ncbi:APC family permease [Gulosibacter massiliensis]|uniref:APC family permease n=1 Tax=Gulosibacter massiliensis TaxID=2479839 RepID=UPI000F633E82|nr:APC family permease [Gulosibacter massiliensis]
MTTNQPQLKRAMGTPTLLMFGIAYMVPLTIFSTYGVVSDITGGRLPLAYIVTTIAMLFTALSYASIVRRLPTAGSAYGYARQAFGRGVGFVTGWGLMVDYMLLPMLNYMLVGLYVNSQFPDVPVWLVIVLAIALVTVLNIIGIEVVRNINVLLVAFQVLFLVFFVVLALGKFSPDASATAPFAVGPDFATVVAGSAILALSFLGFDAVSTLAEEAKDARRTVPRAVLLTVVVGGVMFVFVSWIGAMVWPDHATFENLDTAPNELFGLVGGSALQAFFLAAYIVGCVASALSSQASTSRVLYSMGRDRMLPQPLFGKINARFQTPSNAILVVAAVSLLALVLPLDTVISVVSFGALAAFSMVNLAVIKFFLIDAKERGAKAIVLYGVLPVIGFALTMWLWFSLSAEALTVGLVWVAIGIIYLAVISKGFRKIPDSSIDTKAIMHLDEEERAQLERDA